MFACMACSAAIDDDTESLLTSRETEAEKEKESERLRGRQRRSTQEQKSSETYISDRWCVAFTLDHTRQSARTEHATAAKSANSDQREQEAQGLSARELASTASTLHQPSERVVSRNFYKLLHLLELLLLRERTRAA